ncbi:unnamed protein product [Rotaria sp. Silwood1]|nr:unnamed protein product [Rotaria sp. Silwood1]
MQSFGFSLPLALSTLVAYIVLFFAQGFKNKKEIIAIGHLFYLDKPQVSGDRNDRPGIWFSTSERLAMTYNRLFGLPYYESAIVEQNLLLNKRQKDEIEMKDLRILDPDYYRFETHVLFDDAFEDDENGNRIPNRYVKQLVATVNVAGAYVHEAVLFISTILGLGTILLTIVSALLIVFSTLTIAELYTISILPALFYILVFSTQVKKARS